MSNLIDAGDVLTQLFAGRSALYLEDEPDFGGPVRLALLEAGFAEVIWVTTGDEALALGLARRFDILILDRQVPNIEGVEVLRRIRAAPDKANSSAQSPALICSMLGAESKRLEGIFAGANDYMVKQNPDPTDYVPKNVLQPEREVVLRVAARLATAAPVPGPAAAGSDTIEYGGFRLNPGAITLHFGSKTLKIGTGLPFRIMTELLKAKGVPMTHTMLWDSCWTKWSFRPDSYINVVDTRIRVLRQILSEQMPAPLRERDSVIANVFLEGFVIRDLSPNMP